MSTDFKPLVIPLGRGLDQAAAKNILGGAQGLRIGRNLDFGLRGGVTGRPGAVRQGTFVLRELTDGGEFGFTAVDTLADTGYADPYVVTVRDGSGVERPGLATRGRLFTRDGSQWTDRLGITQARAQRICEFLEVGTPDIVIGGDSMNQAGCASYDFGPCQNAVTGTSDALALLGSGKTIEDRATVVQEMTCGNGARCGAVSAIIHTAVGSNDLTLVTYNSATDAYFEYTIASDARTPTGQGDAPCICCDYDQTVFYVVYWTTTANTLAVKRITPATGAVTHTHSWSSGIFGTKRGIWITNTSVATNRVVVAATGDAGGEFSRSRILSGDTLADQSLDLSHDAGGLGYTNSGQIVCGVAEGGEVWLSWINDLGRLNIGKRSLTAATLLWSRYWQGHPATDVGGSGANGYGPTFFIQHQPVKVGGRVLLGLSTQRATGISYTGSAATWTVHDVTDLWTELETLHQTRDPIIVAKGESYRSMAPWGPMAAIMSASGASSYRFPSVDWQSLRFSSPTLIGERGLLGLNEITLDTFQAAHFKESTIIAGSVPRALSRGHTHPVGFPWQEAPLVVLEAQAAGAVPVGSYTFVAVWTWVDDAGQVHRSEPSFPMTVTTSGGIQKISVLISVPHFNERETGRVYIELYSTAVNPAAGAPRYFRRRYEYPGTDTETVGEIFVGASDFPADGQVFYTDGQVFEAQTPDTSGGLVTLGARCWASDGSSLYASRLGPNGEREAPSWFLDGALTIKVPSVAGRVVGLAALDDKLLAFCERGVYMTGGEGFDDTGQGSSFGTLVKVSDLGLAHQRALAATPKGVVFQSANYKADGRDGTGGLWLLDRGLNCNIISTRTQDE